MSRRLMPLLLIALLPLGAHAEGFARLAELAERGFLVGAEARLLDEGGEVLGVIEPHRPLSPASVTKLYTAAAALERWGPQHRFTTRLVTAGRLDGQGVLHGDLVLEGGGDPGLVDEDLWRLVQQLRQHGVRRVEGRLIISQWRFGPVTCTTTDRCQARARAGNAYSALLSSAGVNHGSWCVKVLPGPRASSSARAVSCHGETPLIPLENGINTLLAGEPTRISAQRVTEGGGDRLVLDGDIALNSAPREFYRASSDPARQTATLLQSLLEQANIAIVGDQASSGEAPPARARTLAAVESQPLQELLLRMLNYSNNFMADVLALNLVEAPQATLPQAGEALERYTLTVPGHGPVTLHSGSGLTTGNRTSATGITALLEAMYRRPALFPSFVAGLQAPANGPMRFIRRGGSTFHQQVMLKTGTLNEPVAVRAVGGYFRTRSGRWGVFGVLVNGTDRTPWLGWPQVLDPLADDLERMIDAH
ncbi:D-alanyl-D-alanine carboxypeptidase/D-alanyl-D-alanine endopeptidase [Halomonas cerina]|uniref:D-alanyl-D-alanine carboxypeptidase/D-alanyl-D-alanine-endopeptidase (Penicillin-binding protein 4) n=1 Tax=Halomonas cerina TaxID=447424 RepID=A0A839VDZ4_9GAMM|nr:D-alanyl-D-alanine carboxypeptidase/D-alanyl-D-alanine-endopeptidase [Halomonas cerina]MBB3192305.1 D-alanyl-D-alanine carboxypeptidase/D-alanyl-D-alanine-endopeptidase (penicillin-binding protein 4) [Halomonas cerina]